MAAPVLFHHASSREHDTGPGHPERVERIVALERVLAEHDWLGWDVRESAAVALDTLHAIHPPAYVESIRMLCESGGGWIDADTVVSARSYEAALDAAGGTCTLVDALLGDGVRYGAALHRPPGHHAETAQAMGFCLFGNVSVAARHALDAHGVDKVMVVDWDVHHGNGTNAIFSGSDEVLFLSIHQSPLYPGTGAASDVGVGAGQGWSVNLPVPAGSGDETFVSLVEHVAAPLLRASGAGLLLISAGFDAHHDDPLAACEVSDDGYAAMTAALRVAADAAGVPVGVVLEGGYDLGALTRGMLAVLSTLSADEVAPPAVAVHPLAAEARERVSRWFDLGSGAVAVGAGTVGTGTVNPGAGVVAGAGGGVVATGGAAAGGTVSAPG
jgi:acetoin utilization deacetylase AcuC-like enzyme